ncbi:MAG: ATP-NAD kinase family protein [Anaerolineae bacterium]|nr:ATP-NAD kinase family protein [Anaerolineae bacterium]
MKRVGLIVNPVAGLGGRVGLKGSDGADVQRRARALGAEPLAGERAAEALARLRRVEALEILTYPGEMGADVVRAAGLEPAVIGDITPGETTGEDTRHAAREMHALGVDLLLFAGGDGTARDVYEAVGLDQPALGIPAGVKIHSAVYATHPASAGELAALYLEGRVASLREAEVMDIDEEAFREGALQARLYGYLQVPFRSNLVQAQKMPSTGEAASLAAIAEDVVAKMEPGVLYIVGPGTTTRSIARELGLDKTLLGVDVVLDGALIAQDANETNLLNLLDEHEQREARIIVTPIGGQGYLFGRGNQQISPNVIQRVGKEQVMVVSTPDKLHALGTQPLLVDTGDHEVDEMLSGYVTVVTGYNERAVRKVSAQ